jgi:propanol-preferring alcohol dehydrogenase
MRAMLLERGGPIEDRPLALVELPDPVPGAGEVRVAIAACGVCRTDLHVIEEDLPPARRPLVPGHMIVGRVDMLGPGVASLALGDRVGIAWLRGTCGACEHCRAGRENLCEHARFTGHHEHGGYAERCVAPARWVYPLPPSPPHASDGLSDVEIAPLLCAGIIGYRALRLSECPPGGRLGLYGFGNSAHVVLQLARARGCEVHVASLRPEHRALAREMGAAWVGDADAMPPGELDSAILFAPAGELVPPILRALRRGGTLACAGIHMTPIPAIDYDAELFGERTLRSVTANTRADGVELLAEAARIGLRPRATEFPLGRANDALLALKQGRIQGAAVLRVAAERAH